MHLLTVFTPCTRFQNLQRIAESLPDYVFWFVGFDRALMSHFEELRKAIPSRCNSWVISRGTGHFGNCVRNDLLQIYEAGNRWRADDWAYCLDDDNIFHPALADNWPKLRDEANSQEANLITWGQASRLRATNSPQVGNIDTASYAWRAGKLPAVRYELSYEADGIFAQQIAATGKVITHDIDMCYYNYLRHH